MNDWKGDDWSQGVWQHQNREYLIGYTSNSQMTANVCQDRVVGGDLCALLALAASIKSKDTPMNMLLRPVLLGLALTCSFTPRVGKAAEAANCTVDTEQLLALSPDAFDQDMNGGWRLLAARKGCEKEAAALIKAYIERNWGKIGQGNLHIMYWHAGQMEALAGDSRLAIPLLMAGVPPDRRRLDIGFHEYALGAIAFLNRDLEGLKAARQRLSVLPQADFWPKDGTGPAKWPPNLSVLDDLIRCFDAPYAVAYSGECKTAPPAP